MSFFGFDTTLPPSVAPKGGGLSLDQKLAALGEDIHIYDFGAEDYGALEAGADELNDETFGGGDAERKRDFDFVGSTARLGVNEPAPTPGSRAPAAPASSSLDFDPLLGPARTDGQARSRPEAPVAAPPAQRPQAKTLAEIEAEMKAQQRARASPRPPRAKTLAEVEAEMRAQQQQQYRPPVSSPPAVHAPPQGPPLGHPPPPPPPALLSLPPHLLQRLPANFHLYPPHQQQAAIAQLQQMALAEQQRSGQSHAPPSTPLPAPEAPVPLVPSSGLPVQQTPGAMFPPLAAQAATAPPPVSHPPPQLAVSELHRLYEQRDQVAKLGNEDLLRKLEEAIREKEKEEARAKRRAQKIEAMAHDNGIMSRSDKDFITRIQVSQLVNSAGPQGSHDPYHDDFYYHVYTAIRMSRSGTNAPQRNQQAGALASKQAMKRMSLAVQRLVDDSKKRPRADQLALNGALGKITSRSNAAPRAALALKPEDLASVHRKTSSLPLSIAPENSTAPPALSNREALVALEGLYVTILAIEQLRRSSPQLASRLDPSLVGVMAPVVPEDGDRFDSLRRKLWSDLRVMDPLDGRDPHPFISLLTPVKGKRLIPRALRQTTAQESLTLLTLLVATFGTLDVVRSAPLLDETLGTAAAEERRRAQADQGASVEVFMSTLVPSAITILSHQPLRVVAGLLGLLVGRNDIMAVAQSRAGVAFLTILLSRAELLKQEMTAKEEGVEAQDLKTWTSTYNALFARLSGRWLNLFPSTRAGARLPPGQGQLLLNTRPDIDGEDQAVWQLLAAIAVSADMQQQQSLVADVREKVLENVFAAKKKTVDPITGERKLRNVDLLLNALGLSSSQIQLDD